MRRNVEIFLRGECFLHLVTMFFIQAWVILLVSPEHIYYTLLAPVFIGISKELFDKYHDKKEISYTDILGTVIGGFLMVLHYKILM